jgi:hypothetical protein
MTRRQKELLRPAQDGLLLAAQDGEVDAGERVTVLDLTTAAVRDYRIVRSATVDPSEGEIFAASPLGSALLGRHVGDVVEIRSRRGNVHLEVVEIDEQPRRTLTGKLNLECSRCGYGIARSTPPERCPMCHAVGSWAHTRSRPSNRSRTSC